MLTKDDIRKLIEVFATREDLEELRAEMVTKTEFHEALNRLDAILGEIKDYRQEQAFHAGVHERITLELEEIKLKLRN